MMTAISPIIQHKARCKYIALLLLLFVAQPAIAQVNASDIENLSDRARRVIDTFLQKTLRAQMIWEYDSRCLTAKHRRTLGQLAQKAVAQLEEITAQQQKLKEQIEQYSGRDWEQRYGSTGLWRTLAADLYNTRLNCCRAHYYFALAAPPEKRISLLRATLDKINSVIKDRNTPQSRLLKARLLALMPDSPARTKETLEHFDTVINDADAHPALVIRARLRKAKFNNSVDDMLLCELLEQIKTNNLERDNRLVLPLVLFCCRRSNERCLDEFLELRPDAANYIGSVILSCLCYDTQKGTLSDQRVQNLNCVEVTLAARAAWTEENYPGPLRNLLRKLARIDKFRIPLVLYAAAISLSEHAPAESVRLLIDASRMQKNKPDNSLNLNSEEIALQAAQLAAEKVGQIPADASASAFENLQKLSPQIASEKLPGLLDRVLTAGHQPKCTHLAEQITAGSQGKWRDVAALYLLLKQPEPNAPSALRQEGETTEAIGDILANPPHPAVASTGTYRRAVLRYCRILLQSDSENAAEKVIQLLDDSAFNNCESAYGRAVCAVRAAALHKQNKPEQATGYMLTALKGQTCNQADAAWVLVQEIMETIERFQMQEPNATSLLENCRLLAQHCRRCRTRNAGLYAAEAAILLAKSPDEVDKAREMVDRLTRKTSIDHSVLASRCRARLLAAEGEFGRAAELWLKIALAQKQQSPHPRQRSWKWWRAKYYELHCLAQQPGTEKHKIAHTIDVLKHSLQDIPPLWEKKLSSLKRRCLTETNISPVR